VSVYISVNIAGHVRTHARVAGDGWWSPRLLDGAIPPPPRVVPVIPVGRRLLVLDPFGNLVDISPAVMTAHLGFVHGMGATDAQYRPSVQVHVQEQGGSGGDDGDVCDTCFSATLRTVVSLCTADDLTTWPAVDGVLRLRLKLVVTDDSSGTGNGNGNGNGSSRSNTSHASQPWGVVTLALRHHGATPAAGGGGGGAAAALASVDTAHAARGEAHFHVRAPADPAAAATCTFPAPACTGTGTGTGMPPGHAHPVLAHIRVDVAVDVEVRGGGTVDLDPASHGSAPQAAAHAAGTSIHIHTLAPPVGPDAGAGAVHVVPQPAGTSGPPVLPVTGATNGQLHAASHHLVPVCGDDHARGQAVQTACNLKNEGTAVGPSGETAPRSAGGSVKQLEIPLLIGLVGVAVLLGCAGLVTLALHNRRPLLDGASRGLGRGMETRDAACCVAPPQVDTWEDPSPTGSSGCVPWFTGGGGRGLVPSCRGEGMGTLSASTQARLARRPMAPSAPCGSASGGVDRGMPQPHGVLEGVGSQDPREEPGRGHGAAAAGAKSRPGVPGPAGFDFASLLGGPSGRQGAAGAVLGTAEVVVNGRVVQGQHMRMGNYWVVVARPGPRTQVDGASAVPLGVPPGSG
jgi:hypothetical protein